MYNACNQKKNPPLLHSPNAPSAPFPSTFPSIILRFPAGSCALEKAFSKMTVPVVKAAYAPTNS